MNSIVVVMGGGQEIGEACPGRNTAVVHRVITIDRNEAVARTVARKSDAMSISHRVSVDVWMPAC